MVHLDGTDVWSSLHGRSLSSYHAVAPSNSGSSLPNIHASSSTSLPHITDSSAQTSDSLLEKHFYRTSYVIGEQLGTETRNLEFKSAQGRHIYRHLKNNVGKYMTAFLNSEGGTLLFGIDDKGKVVGVQCCHQAEDRIRLDIDGVMGKIKPLLTTSMYSVNFQRVTNESGHEIDDLKVIEVIIRPPPGSRDKLYESQDGTVYVRRDASLQRLTPAFIQEWTKQRTERKLKEQGENLTRKHSKLHQHLNDRQVEEAAKENEVVRSQLSKTLQQMDTLTMATTQLAKDLLEQKTQIEQLRKRSSLLSTVCTIV